MASALTVLLLGCWLARRSGAWREGSLPKPSISVSPGGVIPVWGNVTIQCWLQGLGMRILLYKDEDGNYLKYTDPAGYMAEFPITSARQEQSGNYTCRYHDKSGSYSEPSDPVQIIVADPNFPRTSISMKDAGSVPAGGTNPTQPGAAPAPTHPGSAGPGESGPPAPLGLTSPLIAGASAAAAGLLLLLLVAFVCYRRTRGRKGAALRPSSTSPMVALKAPAQQDPVYASVDEGNELQTLEPDPDAEGLTYAELDGRVLQAKRGGPAPAPEPTQPSVYAAINVNRGAPQ